MRRRNPKRDRGHKGGILLCAAVAACLLAGIGGGAAAEGAARLPSPAEQPASICLSAAEGDEAEAAVAAKCCKICRVGKACGDSCINHNMACTEPPGCACDDPES